jgi:Predicted RNA-binding protein (contains KH domain)
MKIVKYPDEVEVKEIDDEENIVYEIYVNPEDVGQIIGKDGRTIKSINIIMNAAKKEQDKKFILKVIR